MQRLFGDQFKICPSTYILPGDYKRFKLDRELGHKNSLYILKPCNAACGRGIKVIGQKTKVNNKKGYIASKYIHKPHLINGLKYDLRIYVVVISYDPLKVYVFQDGLVRFATVKYSTSSKSLKKRHMHLTNYSVNKKADQYKKNSKKDASEFELGFDEASSKWSL